MIGLWFSFGGDAGCLLESAAQWRSTFPDSPVAVCDDSHHPVSLDTLAALSPDHYERSEVGRNRNIRGADIILTILDFQERMHLRYPDHQGAVKVDCDTLICHSDWIDENRPLCGFEFPGAPFPVGCARYIRRDAASLIYDKLLSRVWARAVKAAEDAVIGVSALSLFGPSCQVIPTVPRRCVGWDYRLEEPLPHVMSADVVTFGNREFAPGSSDCEKRESAAVAMAKFRKEREAWLKS